MSRIGPTLGRTRTLKLQLRGIVELLGEISIAMEEKEKGEENG